MKNQSISKAKFAELDALVAQLKSDVLNSRVSYIDAGEEWFALKFAEGMIKLCEEAKTWEPPADE